MPNRAAAVAKAAQSEERAAFASASPAAHANVAPPGTYAAKFGKTPSSFVTIPAAGAGKADVTLSLLDSPN